MEGARVEYYRVVRGGGSGQTDKAGGTVRGGITDGSVRARVN